MALTPSSDLSAANWIAASDQPWQRLAEFGPPGFAAYARLRFLPDPAFEGQSENDVDLADDAPSDTAQLRVVLGVLARHTRTPDDCCFCLWDGWGWTVEGGGSAWAVSREKPSTTAEPMLTLAPPPGAMPARRDPSNDPPSAPHAPTVAIPNRAYFLFHGSVSELADWGAPEQGPGGPIGMPDPAFVWPADHAWCVANDVDPHWAGIGADTAAIDQLIADPESTSSRPTQTRTNRATGDLGFSCCELRLRSSRRPEARAVTQRNLSPIQPAPTTSSSAALGA